MKADSKVFSLEALLRQAGRHLRINLSERFIPQPGEIGSDREETIRQFLRTHLPKRFSVSTGFAFDANGRVSQQLDIIISDSMLCAHFETAGGIRFYPCESIVAVGQIKSSLTSRAEFRNALSNLESVKILDRSARGRAIDNKFGEAIDQTSNHLHQIFTFLFVLGDSLAQDTIRQELMDHVLRSAPHLWPNIVFALDKYLGTFCCDSGICPNPMDARGIAFQPAVEGDELLMKFYLLLGNALEVTRVSSLPYWEYLKEATAWSAEVWHSCADDPPPYLSSITLG